MKNNTMLNYRAKPKLKRPSEKLEPKISKNIINSECYITSDKFNYVNFWDLGLKLNPKIDVFCPNSIGTPNRIKPRRKRGFLFDTEGLQV